MRLNSLNNYENAIIMYYMCSVFKGPLLLNQHFCDFKRKNSSSLVWLLGSESVPLPDRKLLLKSSAMFSLTLVGVFTYVEFTQCHLAFKV